MVNAVEHERPEARLGNRARGEPLGQLKRLQDLYMLGVYDRDVASPLIDVTLCQSPSAPSRVPSDPESAMALWPAA
jgi:hypothetical protein